MSHTFEHAAQSITGPPPGGFESVLLIAVVITLMIVLYFQAKLALQSGDEEVNIEP